MSTENNAENSVAWVERKICLFLLLFIGEEYKGKH